MTPFACAKSIRGETPLQHLLFDAFAFTTAGISSPRRLGAGS